jgi:hypothetical protein
MVCNFSLVLCGLDRGTVGWLRSLDYDISGNSFFFYVQGGVSAVVFIRGGWNLGCFLLAVFSGFVRFLNFEWQAGRRVASVFLFPF